MNQIVVSGLYKATTFNDMTLLSSHSPDELCLAFFVLILLIVT